ncbi:MAG TPA: adenylate/guanylate cyclase domain-containing protein [Actinomycetes bacterium]|nr:adenylate/guanylate cyclase domain-containing protein [Actinomycetes bacterium]
MARQAVPPETRYARVGEDRVAYQVLGEGPPDLVFTMGAFSDVDVVWEDPQMALFLRRLGSFTRLLRFDRRGTGASDPLPPDPLPPWEAYVEELVAVMDAAGSRRAALLATGPQAGPMALFFAGTKPERTEALILTDATARYLVADDYPIGFPPEATEAMIARAERLWGTEQYAGTYAPGRAGDERFLRWSARLERAIASPRMVRTYLRALLELDVRAILPLIQAPTLLLAHRGFEQVPVEHGRYLAEHIPGARLVELPGQLPLFWAQPDVALEQIERFLGGDRRGVEPTRVLATVLFTDIVGSTRRAAELGDRSWRQLLEVHDELAGRLVEQWGGRLVKTTGDGILATFDGPGRAIGCAAALRDQLRDIGTEIRAGVHTGEVELRGDDVGGIAVHIAARIMATAGAGEIVVSRTVRDLVVGSEVVLRDRGSRRLEGVEGDWQLFVVAGRS